MGRGTTQRLSHQKHYRSGPKGRSLSVHVCVYIKWFESRACVCLNGSLSCLSERGDERQIESRATQVYSQIRWVLIYCVPISGIKSSHPSASQTDWHTNNTKNVFIRGIYSCISSLILVPLWGRFSYLYGNLDATVALLWSRLIQAQKCVGKKNR